MNKLNIIALPFGGGNRYSYDSFRTQLPSNYLLNTVEYPGRGERLNENTIFDIKLLAKDVLKQINYIINKEKYIIYGHSMGTLVGYELTKLIVKYNYQPPLFLFFTGRGGPSIEGDKKISKYIKDKFWEEVNNMGGLSSEVLSNKELLDYFEPIFRADFEAVESYNYKPMSKPFMIPINVMAGLDEEDITKEKLMAWQKETIFPLKKQFLNGNHFFIFKNINYIVKYINEEYQKINIK
jgi:surfactin synthase thioesterase subunit